LFGVGQGNCFAACVACFLEIPVSEIPNFCVIYGEPWFERFVEWCGNRGWRSAYLLVGIDWARLHLRQDVFWIASGLCPPRKNGEQALHCCVYQYDKLWHDPNPERSGLVEVVDCIFLWRAT